MRVALWDSQLNPPWRQAKKTNCRIGIVTIADEASASFELSGVWRLLERWIQVDAPMAVTGHFGKNNEDDIAKLAVAACASVDHRIRVKMRFPADMLPPAFRDSFAFAPSGFILFAKCDEPIEEMSEFPVISFACLSALWPRSRLLLINYAA